MMDYDASSVSEGKVPTGDGGVRRADGMRGLLTEEQRAQALAYEGPVGSGSVLMPRVMTADEQVEMERATKAAHDEFDALILENRLAFAAFRAWVSSPDTLVNESAIPAMWDKINEHGKEGWRRIVRALRKELRDGGSTDLSSYEQP